ncbi:MAG: hypothetical protein JRM79_03315 [Nitrososphaerota archaeon]|nr:hypothetical protein [Nitrososphaerota archaeon]MDG6937431.1 hypothetical protein [Nitrososphaerota archaeon]MDG6958663.1 hypothetical protein [Nitrososphaerota archaeon]MDG6971082.1 hypothetical protein [Nitrososphaerota archaeon]MDG6972706.1 hypothetical protein [Nitrososphaerota archaeon]
MAESGILNELLVRLIAITNGIAADVTKGFESFLRNSERLVIWVTTYSVAVQVARETDIRLQSIPPHLAILLAKGLARTNLDRVLSSLGKLGYVIERDEVEKQHTAYVYTKEARGSVKHWAELFTEESKKK